LSQSEPTNSTLNRAGRALLSGPTKVNSSLLRKRSTSCRVWRLTLFSCRFKIRTVNRGIMPQSASHAVRGDNTSNGVHMVPATRPPWCATRDVHFACQSFARVGYANHATTRVSAATAIRLQVRNPTGERNGKYHGTTAGEGCHSRKNWLMH
jgi:hypothetical protein